MISTKLLLTVFMLARFIVAPAADSPIVVKDPNTAGLYRMALSNDSKIKIGSQAKFIPKFELSKWTDKAYLRFDYPVTVNLERESLADGRVAITAGGLTHRYYKKVILIDPNIPQSEREQFEYEIEIPEKPPANRLTLNLEFPDGLDFWYQDTLENEYLRGDRTVKDQTLKQYLSVNHRPHKVVGSYAVYWNKRHRQYKTGKFCHIYRPELVDADGKRVWCEQHIDVNAKTWQITMPQKFLDSCRYPVILGPTIGDESEGASSTNYADNIVVSRFTCSANGSTAQATLYAFIYEPTATSEHRVCVYADNAGTADGQALLSTNNNVITTAPVFYAYGSATLTPPAFANGTDYWIGIHSDEVTSSKLYFDTTGGDQETDTQDFDSGLTNPFGTAGTTERNNSVYVDYTAAAASETGQVIMISN